MAAIGDSITQASNADLFRFGGSNPGQSWSTGDDATDPIVSHHERLTALRGGAAGPHANFAVSGRTMADAPRQAAQAVEHGADYVTLLLGANDVCAPSAAEMTAPPAFEASFRQAMAILVGGLPGVRVYVASIPDIHQLWSLHQGHLLARLIWEWFNICPPMLAGSNTEADRQLARARNVELNAVLGRVCAEFTECRFDGNRVFDHRVTAAEVSIVDFFHPSIEGLRNLAQLTWETGYWPTPQSQTGGSQSSMRPAKWSSALGRTSW
jgi:lysophospholipase L1-like esterase